MKITNNDDLRKELSMFILNEALDHDIRRSIAQCYQEEMRKNGILYRKRLMRRFTK